MKENKKKIVFSGNTAWGMLNFRGNVLRHFSERADVIVIAPHDDIYTKKLQDIGCEVIDIEIQAKGTNPFTDFMLILKYIRLFKRIKPDYSVTYTIKPNIYASIAAGHLGIPYLPITTGLGYIFLHNDLISKIAKSLYRFAFRKAEQVWFLNHDDMRIFKESKLVDEDKIKLLHSEGIDTSYLQYEPVNQDQNSFKFLLVGRMIADKGLYEYAEAAKIVKQGFPNTEFWLLGPLWKENPAAVSEEQLKQWDNEGIVKYCGATNDVRQFIKQVDCVVLPSKYREGVPFTLMEGASMGRPIIATNIPGCQDVIIDGVTGFLCEVKNTDSLANAMERLLSLTPAQRAQMGRAGREYMEREFDITHIIKQYDMLLGGVL